MRQIAVAHKELRDLIEVCYTTLWDAETIERLKDQIRGNGLRGGKYVYTGAPHKWGDKVSNEIMDIEYLLVTEGHTEYGGKWITILEKISLVEILVEGIADPDPFNGTNYTERGLEMCAHEVLLICDKVRASLEDVRIPPTADIAKTLV